jgi:hypothetical protein
MVVLILSTVVAFLLSLGIWFTPAWAIWFIALAIWYTVFTIVATACLILIGYNICIMIALLAVYIDHWRGKVTLVR